MIFIIVNIDNKANLLIIIHHLAYLCLLDFLFYKSIRYNKGFYTNMKNTY